MTTNSKQSKRSTNPCTKKVTPEKAYEVYQSGDIISWGLKKYQNETQERMKPYVRCHVASKSPATGDRFESVYKKWSRLASQANRKSANKGFLYTL